MRDRMARILHYLRNSATGWTSFLAPTILRKWEGFGISLSSLALLTVLSYGMSLFEMVSYLHEEKQVRRVRLVGEAIERVREDFEEYRLGREGYLLSGQPSYLVSYTTGIEKMIRNFRPLRRLIRDEGSKAPLSLLDDYTQSKGSILARTSHMLERRGLMETRSHFLSDQGNTQPEGVSQVIKTLVAYYAQKLRTLRQNVQHRILKTTVFFASSFLFFASFLAVAASRILRDVHSVNSLTASLHHEARHDPLTGLSNRAFAMDWLEYSLSKMRKEGGRLAILFIDLDRFKEINDLFGHDRGDMALVTVAQRFMGVIRTSDVLCRLGGDEFVLIASGYSDPGTPAQLAERLILTLSEPVRLLDDERALLGASIGISSYPMDGETPGELMNKADIAMYRAKEKGGNRICQVTETGKNLCS